MRRGGGARRAALTWAFPVTMALVASAPAHAQSSARPPSSPAGPSPAAAGPSPDELRAARDLFASAYKDEQEKRYAQALEKFQRVATVKESASVRYRIASVLESLGRLREARDDFRALAASKPGLPLPEQEIADSAAERAHQLDKRIPRLVVKLQDNPPPDTRVTVDGASVAASTAARPIEVDPGEHVVQATSSTTSPSESRVTLVEGSEVEVMVVLTPPLAPKPRQKLPVEPPPREDGRPRRDPTLGIVALAAGGVLLVTGIVMLAVRQGDISDIETNCRAGTCPSGKRTALQSEHDQASLFGPLGAGAAILGIAGIGLGGYLLLWPAPAASGGSAPVKGTTPASPKSGLRLTPRPLPGGGGIVGMTTAF